MNYLTDGQDPADYTYEAHTPGPFAAASVPGLLPGAGGVALPSMWRPYQQVRALGDFTVTQQQPPPPGPEPGPYVHRTPPGLPGPAVQWPTRPPQVVTSGSRIDTSGAAFPQQRFTFDVSPQTAPAPRGRIAPWERQLIQQVTTPKPAPRPAPAPRTDSSSSVHRRRLCACWATRSRLER